MRIEFGQWFPDLPALDNPGCTIAENARPALGGYSSVNAINDFATLSAACIGAFSMSNLSASYSQFAGDASKLYHYDGANFDDVSRTAGYSTAVSWNFEKFGNRCIAVDVGHAPQFFELSAGGTSIVFQDLGGSPPQARYVAAVRDFVVLANLDGAPYTLQWSAFNNSDLWTPSLATQSDSQLLPGRGGEITGIVPGEYGVVFQKSSIWRMDYQGPPVVFRINEVERGIGCIAPRSIVWHGGVIYFYDKAGFHRFDGSSQPVPIGIEIAQWFRDRCDDLTAIVGVVDRERRVIMWQFQEGSANRVLMYNLDTQWWGYSKQNTSFMSEWRSGTDTESVLGWLNEEAGFFDGAGLVSLMESKELRLTDGNSLVTKVRLLGDLEGATLLGGTVANAFTRESSFGSASSSPATTHEFFPNRYNDGVNRVNAKFIRFQMGMSDFTLLKGFDLDIKKSGER